MKNANYPNNIYIVNHEDIKAMGGDINVCLSHDKRARAQYKHWRAEVTGVPELMSVDDRRILEDE